jgi:hypothetical protein
MNMLNVQIKDFGIDALHLAVLFGFAVAQPLYDIFSRNPEFFTAHQSRPFDIIAFAVILSFIFPLLGIVIECIAWLFSGQVRKRVHMVFTACLFILIASPVLDKINGIPAALTAAGAVVFGITAAFLYYRFSPVQMIVTVLSPVIVLFPALFLLYSPVSGIVSAQQDTQAAFPRIESTAPIIMIVFDELPVSSLMDKRRQIDQVRYPHFAALARDAYWFRNYSTNGERTEIALTSLLTGSYSDHKRVPTYAQYPRNLFSLLGGSYDMQVLEPDTMLCPDSLCESGKDRTRFLRRIRPLLLDSSVVYLHIVLPRNLTAALPPVTLTWKGFWRDTPARTDQARFNYYNKIKKQNWQEKRADVFTAFIDSIGAYNSPGLYFLHSELPHAPWEYLPSGREYAIERWAIPGLDMQSDMWDADEWLVIQGYQRHLLQVGFVDRLLGKLIAKLKDLDIYERSLIIVTADHGVHFLPGKNRRSITKEHSGNIILVPLFIKAPHQHEGMISDRVVESVDILPTIADILDIELPWNVDGYSALDSSFPERQERIIYNHSYEKIEIGADRDMIDHDLKRKIALFGDGSEQDGLFTVGPFRELIGRDIRDIGVSGNASIATKIEQGALFENVSPESLFVPALISGFVIPSVEAPERLKLAIAVNGKIAGVTRAFHDADSDNTKFSAVVSESSFRKGSNDVAVFVVSGSNRSGSLLRTGNRSGTTYSLAVQEIIISTEGKTIPVMENAFQGSLDGAIVEGDQIIFDGWAADVEHGSIPDAIAIFVNGKFFYSDQCNKERPDVVAHFEKRSLIKSGFRYQFPVWTFRDIENSEIRFFAVSDAGMASELTYPEEYLWGKKIDRQAR